MRLSVFITVLFLSCSLVFAQGILIDHTSTDLSEIPQAWITTVQNNIQSHYAHTSHGGQLTYGIGFVEDQSSFYDCEIGSGYLPTASWTYCVFDTSGRSVQEVFSVQIESGEHSFSIQDLSCGVYIVRLRAGDASVS